MVKILAIEDIPKLKDLANEFYSSSEILEYFDIDTFTRTWLRLYEQKQGVVIGLVDDDNSIYGALGVVKYNDPNNDELIAMEFFWFVSETKRGEGMLLLEAFEKWAKDQGCKKVHMVHLADLMPKVVERIYKMKGYRHIETVYSKEVS